MEHNNIAYSSSNQIIFRNFVPIAIVLVLILIEGILGIGCLAFAYYSFDCNPSTINLGMIMFFEYFGGNQCEYSTTNDEYFSNSSRASNSTSLSEEFIAIQNMENSPSSSSLSDLKITLKDFNRNHLPETIYVAKRTQIVLMVYTVISFLWIVTSFLALISCICKCFGRTVFYIIFAPWFTVIIAGCILDLAAMVLHIYDIANTRSLEATFTYLELVDIPTLEKITNFSNDYFFLPIIMACITSKFLILWIVNLFGSFLVIRQSKKIVHAGNSAHRQNDFDFRKKHGFDEIRNIRNSCEMREKASCGVQTDNLELATNLQSHQDIAAEGNIPHSEHSINLARQHSSISQQTLSDSGPMRNNDNKNQLKTNHETDSDSRLSVSSSLSRVQSIKEKIHLTEELRSQLPWSYLNARNDIGTSIRVLTHHEHKEVSPPVPVPDYDAEKYRQQDHPTSSNLRYT